MFKIQNNNNVKKIATLACLVTGFSISPVVFATENGKLSLAEAVKMTLELSPTRFIQQASVTAAQAGVEIQEGAFNPTTSAGVNYGRFMNHLITM